VFPNILPGILSGVALALAKAIGEFGRLVIITGTSVKTEVTSSSSSAASRAGDRRVPRPWPSLAALISFALLP
jgi:ABC-type sulfate transport system permease component